MKKVLVPVVPLILLLPTLLLILFCEITYGGQYMKAQSNHRPQDTIKCKGSVIVNYNIKEIEITDEHGTRTTYEYDYVEIENELTKAKFKEALRKKDLKKKDVKEWTPSEAVLEYENEIRAKVIVK